MDFQKLTRKTIVGLGLATVACQALPSYAASISALGFGSFYGAKATNKDLMPSDFTSTSTEFQNFSLIGTDITAKIDDQWSLQGEILASGQPGPITNYMSFVQWAFLNYKPTDSMNIKIGRQRYALWMASEFINTHHALPFRTLPSIVYKNAPMNAFDGVFISQGFDVGIGNFDVALFGGAPVLDMNIPSVTFDLKNLYGVRAVLKGDGWRVRVQASQFAIGGNLRTSVTVPSVGVIPINMDMSGHERIISGGYRFDKYDIVSWGEYSMISSSDGTSLAPLGTSTFMKSVKSGYIVGGYRLGQFLPRYTFAKATSDIGFGETGATTHTFGLDYFATDKVTIRAEYEMVSIPSAGKGVYALPTQPAGATATSGGAFYLGADFII